ncbi:Chemotaxis protein CheY [Neomoorella glycerini]|uniref:Stage 0 sporulation protein A homolog n=1 Tax=Neomoorella glycerini TaxID=55779 RepID=A0A6I5ZM15_9FIRM|nr:response regulator [Moorella glycerini]QGP90878.1 Chemotaxis protein CheY [Moorella glycerini]
MVKVLIVDDSSAVRAYHAAVLQGCGFAVDVAANGYEGLEKICAADYDVLLVDVNMPSMHGYELVKEIRKTERGQSMGIIMISTEAGPHDRLAAYKAGADLYLVKPVDPEELKKTCLHLAGLKGGTYHEGTS